MKLRNNELKKNLPSSIPKKESSIVSFVFHNGYATKI